MGRSDYDSFVHGMSDMMDAVNKAVEGNDYSSLTKNINIVAQNLNEELSKYAANIEARNNRNRNTNRNGNGNHRGSWDHGDNAAKSPFTTTTTTTVSTPWERRTTTTTTQHYRGARSAQIRPSRGGNTVKIICGAFLMCIGLPALITYIFTGLTVGGLGIMDYLVAGGMSYGGYYLVSKGTKANKLINEANKYLRIIGSNESIKIYDLAKLANEDEAKVVSNLVQIIDKGYMPNARLGDDNEVLIMSTEVYKEYLENIKNKRAKQTAKSKADEEIDKLNVSNEVKEIMRNGQTFVNKIQDFNDRIPDESMSAKLDELKNIVNKIFNQVKANPSSAGDLRKLMNYYLPTTEKLLTAYVDLDKQSGKSINVAKTKKEIEGAMDTINNAFVNLFDSMFDEVALDISSDISAMKMMMEQDGLTDKQFTANANSKM